MNGQSGNYTLAAGEQNLTVDAGFQTAPPPATASIGDRVWFDANYNGVQDAGETGAAGVMVEVLQCASNAPTSTVVATLSTNASGNWLQTVAPGSYAVRFTAPAGYALTLPNTGSNDAADSDALSAAFPAATVGRTGCYTVANNESNITIDAGVLQSANCMVVIDEDGLDDGIKTVQLRAQSLNVTPYYLVNDQGTGLGNNGQNVSLPTEIANPWLKWNLFYAGDIVKLPTGQLTDEGWFAPPPPPIRYFDYKPNPAPPSTYEGWLDAFVKGTLTQSQLDKVLNVQPLRNQELAALIGKPASRLSGTATSASTQCPGTRTSRARATASSPSRCWRRKFPVRPPHRARVRCPPPARVFTTCGCGSSRREP